MSSVQARCPLHADPFPKFFSLLRLLARRNYSTFASSGRNRVISQTRYTIQLPLNLVD
ncbi:hypothetical protein GECvBN5_gp081 [Salmonella phage GEC_vB_N5]|uniref:Uncharacterized protein n=3 Tax=Markadamsvirinae TaxID=2732013 RepID=A0A7S9XEC4_9CAUD|nr:hypothetical protein GECvBN3_gp084 [Salmonella phage GEC_vB_N3]QPI15097.1 hypothetical protein GECvBN5_gp081 [Salmonella phage GEC_vB_N5]UYL23141.1 hypothetical protein [Salmonella phage PS3-1]